jgi:hypothetical protein
MALNSGMRHNMLADESKVAGNFAAISKIYFGGNSFTNSGSACSELRSGSCRGQSTFE